MKDDFAERLALLCELKGLKQRDVAKRARVDLSRVCRWFSGTNKPRDIGKAVQRVLKMDLAEFYSVDLSELRSKSKAA